MKTLSPIVMYDLRKGLLCRCSTCPVLMGGAHVKPFHNRPQTSMRLRGYSLYLEIRGKTKEYAQIVIVIVVLVINPTAVSVADPVADPVADLVMVPVADPVIDPVIDPVVDLVDG